MWHVQGRAALILRRQTIIINMARLIAYRRAHDNHLDHNGWYYTVRWPVGKAKCEKERDSRVKRRCMKRAFSCHVQLARLRGLSTSFAAHTAQVKQKCVLPTCHMVPRLATIPFRFSSLRSALRRCEVIFQTRNALY